MTAISRRFHDVITDPNLGLDTEGSISLLLEGLSDARAILLRTLVAEVTALAPGAVGEAGLVEAYRYLAECQRTHPAAVAAALNSPQLGIWLGRTLQRARGVAIESRAPLWADCGYLGWLAAAVGIGIHPEGSMGLVVRNGAVLLPGIGMAMFGSPGHCGRCTVSWAADGSLSFTGDAAALRVRSVRDDSHPAWRPLRRLSRGDHPIDVALDDLDPFRKLPAGHPEWLRLSAEEAELWQADFAAAWELLRTDFERYTGPMRECLQSVVPLSAGPLVASTSHTAYDGVGCVYTTAPADPCQLALTLIHEIQHTKFTLFTDQVRLVHEQDPALRCYAPWRADPRPVFGLLHGIYAFAGVTDFWRIHRNSRCHGSMRAHVDFELGRVQLQIALEQVLGSGVLTPEGEHFFEAVATAIRPWADEHVPEHVRRAVAEVTVANRTFWQVRNRQPAASVIADLAARWRAARPAPRRLPPSTWVDQRRVPEHHRSLRLAAQLTALDSAEQITQLSSSDQPEGDRSYLAGDIPTAFARYLWELRDDPLRPQLWAGMALALPQLFPESDFGILSDRAEVAAHLYAAVDPDTGLVALLRWLSAGESGDE